MLSEKQLISVFEDKSLPILKNMIKVPELRVYSYEFPVSYEGQNGRIDMVLEIVNNGNLFDRSNPIIALEFKKNNINHGPVDQLNFYLKVLGKKLYRPNVSGWLVAPSFSVHEIEEASKNKIKCLMMDEEGNVKFVRGITN